MDENICLPVISYSAKNFFGQVVLTHSIQIENTPTYFNGFLLGFRDAQQFILITPSKAF